MKLIILLITTASLIMLIVNGVFAQPPGLPDTPDQAPLGGGMALLIAAGGAYAYRKLRKG